MTRIASVRVTPIAFRDPPLLNVAGVHEPWALRSVIEVETRDGLVGLGESYGDETTLAGLARAAPHLAGFDPFDLNALTRAVYADADPVAPFPPAGDKPRATLLAAFEVAFLDLQGQLTGRPVCDLLGGRVRGRVPCSAYLFYRLAQHRDDPDPADDWGEALTHEQVVA